MAEKEEGHCSRLTKRSRSPLWLSCQPVQALKALPSGSSTF
ncbi:hypothetical protein AVDCRST_MAG94-7244 [uncultured Leptolyngbya sp.]|uniref:Uncharacterized protein n=1 Tax=uncultured Leptolyngbya sp. TaxID=332963 RepID=A0A6J4PVH5_9CYAN|nr:hypothetical protein AVDCRST_MAG94-7244 [uncultured Leptolyngbya sp.]